MILLGWVVTAMPLLFAIAFASHSLNRLAERSEAAIQDAALSARLGWELEEDLTLMARILRQYEVLRDATLLEDYAEARNEWRHHATGFAGVPLLQPLAAQIAAMQKEEETAHRTLSGGAPELKALHETLVRLEELGISIDEVTAQLEVEGVEAFSDAFTVLLKAVEERVKASGSK